MRARFGIPIVVGSLAISIACGGAPPPPPEPLEPADAAPVAVQAAPPEPPPPIVNEPPPPPPTTATYEEAIATPESLDIKDDAPQLTDGQLTAPMRGVLRGCRMPAKTFVTIKTAVRGGHAIGVTVDVHVPPPAPPRPPRGKLSPAQKKLLAAKEEQQAKVIAKTVARITECVDKNVRAITWPPSRRRDTFVTTFDGSGK